VGLRVKGVVVGVIDRLVVLVGHGDIIGVIGLIRGVGVPVAAVICDLWWDDHRSIFSQVNRLAVFQESCWNDLISIGREVCAVSPAALASAASEAVSAAPFA
jgi:hypothetical protein